MTSRGQWASRGGGAWRGGHCFLATQGMITLILATDMARHAEIMDAFKDKLESFDYSNEEHVTLVSALLVPLWGAAEGALPSSSA